MDEDVSGQVYVCVSDVPAPPMDLRVFVALFALSLALVAVLAVLAVLGVRRLGRAAGVLPGAGVVRELRRIRWGLLVLCGVCGGVLGLELWLGVQLWPR